MAIDGGLLLAVGALHKNYQPAIAIYCSMSYHFPADEFVVTIYATHPMHISSRSAAWQAYESEQFPKHLPFS